MGKEVGPRGHLGNKPTRGNKREIRGWVLS